MFKSNRCALAVLLGFATLAGTNAEAAETEPKTPSFQFSFNLSGEVPYEFSVVAKKEFRIQIKQQGSEGEVVIEGSGFVGETTEESVTLSDFEMTIDVAKDGDPPNRLSIDVRGGVDAKVGKSTRLFAAGDTALHLTVEPSE